MRIGDVLADRFELEALAGAGGMGAVWRARDRVLGQTVALKLIGEAEEPMARRFDREVEVLSHLSHPGIVSYVAHGRTSEGGRYLAMEWLEGEDLDARLRRGGLSVEESLGVVRRAASALAVAHAQGLLHRDLKPGNLFLVNRDPAQVKVIDFGVARPADRDRGLTGTGVMVGTLSYMSPEQARGLRELTGAVDVFALGCVLFECLSGQRAFAGGQPVAILAKILFDDPPRVRALRPELSPELDALVAALMARDPTARPPDAAALVRRLDALRGARSGPPVRAPAGPSALTAGEQRLVSVLLVGGPGEAAPGLAETLTPEAHAPDRAATVVDRVQAAVGPLGARVTPLVGGVLLVKVEARGTAIDQASRAAACALAVHEALPGAPVALATGSANVAGPWPAGQVIDRAAALLRLDDATSPSGIWIDELTAGLLGPRYRIAGDGPRRCLVGARASAGRRRLRRTAPCVGRERELGVLEVLCRECVAEPAAGAVLVTGAAGVGKSRLVQEALERLARGAGPDLLAASGDPITGGSAFHLAAQLVRQAAGLDPAAPTSAQREVLASHLASAVTAADREWITAFLSVLVSLPPGDAEIPRLRAARLDARIMSEALGQAFVTYLGARCAARPVLVVLEDLQWGDLPSVTLVGRALEALAASPLLVIATGRPEVHDVFPRLWTEAGRQTIALGALRRAAATRLARTALGAEVPDEAVERIVDQAGGNPFYLEELARHLASGGGRDLPGTVVAMVQSRLAALDPEARRVLRAGSLLGSVFWEGAVAHLLGDTVLRADLRGWLERLVAQEVVDPVEHTRFPGEQALAFRHDLYREAAYAMLTDEDRRTGHALCGAWLVTAGETDARVIAEHLVAGEAHGEAIPYLLRAAQVALDAGSLDAALDLAERGIACGATGAIRGELRLVEAQRLIWQDDLPAAVARATEALELLPEGTTTWFMALAATSHAAAYGANLEALLDVLARIQAYERLLPAIAPSGLACATLVNSLQHLGQAGVAAALVERLQQAAASPDAPRDAVFAGWLCACEALLGLYAPDLARAVDRATESCARFQEAGDELAGAMAHLILGSLLVEVGRLDEGAATCRRAGERAQALGSRFVTGYATIFIGLAQALRGEHAAALQTLARAAEATDPLLVTITRTESAYALLLAGRPAEAAAEAEAAVDGSAFLPIMNTSSLAVLAAAQLALGDAAAARSTTERGLAQREQSPAVPMYDRLLRLTHAEALAALGEHAAAAAALADARARLLAEAAGFADPGRREQFLTGLPVNASIRRG
jgi:tetratricopeptide (TPR) repeat protein